MATKDKKIVPDQAPPRRRPARNVVRDMHTDALWLYGTIAALAIEEALSKTMRLFITPPENSSYNRVVHGVRLLVFLVVLTHFYLGSAFFFRTAYADEAGKNIKRKNYVTDFIFGLAHFVLFFTWAYVIDLQLKPMNLFPILLGVILILDLIWLSVSFPFDTLGLIKFRAFFNLATFLVAFMVYGIAWFFASGPPEKEHVIAEQYAFAMVIMASVVGIAELVSDQKLARKLLKWFPN